MKKIIPIQKYHIALAALFVFGGVLLFTLDNRGLFSKQSFGIKKDITILHSVNNEVLVGQTRAETVCELLDEQGLKYTESDRISPECDTALFSDMEIEILPKLSVLINVDDSQKEFEHHGTETLQEILTQENIEVRESDLISIDAGETLTDRQEVDIIRVTQEQVIETQRILFQEVIEQSDQFTTDYEEITQEGEEGEEEITYTITLHDGEEVEREESARKVAKEKKDRIITRGTRESVAEAESTGDEEDVVEQAEGGLELELDIESLTLGDSHEGQSSWYAYKDCDCAANPWLPKGSRVKVTAVNSGKSVIVTINDRGPFVPGRIIDLDKTAFEKIAPLGAGVIDVKMEEIID